MCTSSREWDRRTMVAKSPCMRSGMAGTRSRSARPAQRSQLANLFIEDASSHIEQLVELLAVHPVIDSAALLASVDDVFHAQDGELLRYRRPLHSKRRK